MSEPTQRPSRVRFPLPVLRTLPPALWAALVLAGFVLLLYYPLLFTNRVLASGDILLYFYPYRDYAAEALREGRIPFWNPYIFLGVPFLANPQAAVLYPLHWPLSWLPVTKQIYWSAALHTWILGYGGYLLCRRWGTSSTAGLIGSLVLAGSGFYGGLIGHINQMNGAAWLPWGLWILSEPNARRTFWSWRRRVAGFALVVALMILAGHTQTAYINLFGIGLWAAWPVAIHLWQWARQRTLSTAPGWPTLNRLALYTGGVLLGGVISAAQLLPTLELSDLGLRSGGLSYGEATALSLPLRQLFWTLLPSYGLVNLESQFATPAYSELIAYVGVAALVLAALGAWRTRGSVRVAGLLFALVGLLLAIGRWNPLYFGLYLIVPGFDLFRTPARWMMLYTLGLALLAAGGWDWLAARGAARRWRMLSAVCVALIAVELLLAAQALPHRQTVAPQAVYEPRTAPAHLLTDPTHAELGSAAAGRFLGMSTITYDPGDMADWRRILLEDSPAQLTPRTFEQFIISLKVQELLVPNLSLFWRIPSVDGFDGGVLPLGRYNEFLTLLIPREELVPDGRLREQVRTVPSTGLLNLLNVQYLITDKVRDLWFEDVYYDRQIGAELHAGLDESITLAPHAFPATHLDLIGMIDGSAADLAALHATNQAVATVTLQSAEHLVDFPVLAGGQPGADLADGTLDSPMAAASGATVAYRDVDGGRQEYRVRLALPEPMTPLTVTVSSVANPFTVTVQALTLLDQRTGMFAPLLPSDRGQFELVHSGDVKLYEQLDLRPRAYLSHDITGVESADAALAALRSGLTQPELPTVVEGLPTFRHQPAPTDSAQILAYAPERVEIRTQSQEPALLVLSDTHYPGWTATVDGEPTPIYTTNYLFRGVPVPAGEHTVLFRYRPTGWDWGLGLSGFGLALVLVLLRPTRRNVNRDA